MENGPWFVVSVTGRRVRQRAVQIKHGTGTNNAALLIGAGGIGLGINEQSMFFDTGQRRDIVFSNPDIGGPRRRAGPPSLGWQTPSLQNSWISTNLRYKLTGPGQRLRGSWGLLDPSAVTGGFPSTVFTPPQLTAEQLPAGQPRRDHVIGLSHGRRAAGQGIYSSGVGHGRGTVQCFKNANYRVRARLNHRHRRYPLTTDQGVAWALEKPLATGRQTA